MSGATQGSCQDALACRCSDLEDTTVDHSGRYSARTTLNGHLPVHIIVIHPVPIPATTQRLDSEGWTTPSTTTALHQASSHFLFSRVHEYLYLRDRHRKASVYAPFHDHPLRCPLLCRSSSWFHRPTPSTSTSTSPSLLRPLPFLPECAEHRRLRNVSYEPH